jgi:hypothetical protein
MPRASWRGFLRLSLVSCPIYLSPATTTPRHDAPDDRERLAARGTAHQQRMPLFAAQQPIGLALFCQ